MSITDNSTSNTAAFTHQVDTILVGMGISGLFLSYYLTKAGQKVVVFDDEKPFTASRVASGIINPVTGRRIVRTWRIDELLPFALAAYTTLGNELGMQVVQSCRVLDFHASLQMKEAFDNRLDDEYLQNINEPAWQQYFNYHFGIGAIEPCLSVDINTLLQHYRQRLQTAGTLINEKFDWNLCMVDAKVTYKNYRATKIISCEGAAGIGNPYFKNLPFAPNKGEVVIADIPGLDKTNIYKQGLTIVPWNNQFWIGSSYEWNFADELPSAAFKLRVQRQLDNWLKLPYTITDHFAAVRPANVERRPFVGMHPHVSNVGIFNGMGTKGCSLAPFFARQFADNIVNGNTIYADADVNRFSRVLARS